MPEQHVHTVIQGLSQIRAVPILSVKVLVLLPCLHVVAMGGLPVVV